MKEMLNVILRRIGESNKKVSDEIQAIKTELDIEGSSARADLWNNLHNLQGKLSAHIADELIIIQEMKKYYETQKQK